MLISVQHPKILPMALQTLQTLPQTLIIQLNVINSSHSYHYSGGTNHMQEKKRKKGVNTVSGQSVHIPLNALRVSLNQKHSQFHCNLPMS